MYIGNDLSRGRVETYYYTSTSGGETSITTDSSGKTINYTVGWVAVYLNGVRLHDSDFTATTGNSITGLAALSHDDVVIIEAQHTFSSSDAVPATGGTFSGNVSFGGTVTMQSANNQGFAAGTKMLFQQTAAPTGWTKVTSSNDVALRVVSGTVGSGGSVAFETAFASQTVPVHTLALSEIPSHGHTLTLYDDHSSGGSTGERVSVHGSGYYQSKTGMGGVGAAGGGGSHGHGSIDLDVQYVDVIIATKD